MSKGKPDKKGSKEKAHKGKTRKTAAETPARDTVAPLLPEEALSKRTIGIYRNLPPSRLENFRYLDVKSLPRTGLHFMRNTFESILRENFSFCEWYTEPGCCKQMPCAVTGYATEAQDRPMLRMAKSHDFDLTDPAFTPLGPIRRLILIRDPLYLLTSWWALQVLYLRAELLNRHGITKPMLSFAHGPHVVRAAYRIIDDEGEMPTTRALTKWLNRQIPYVTGFTAKWNLAVQEDGVGTRIVRYRETPDAILDMLDEIAGSFDDETRSRLETFRQQRDTVFVQRPHPFESQSTRISAFLTENARHFQEAAQEIITRDTTGLLETS